MRKILVALVVAAGLVAVPAADAHTLSITTARAVTAEIAHEQFLVVGWANSWGVGTCSRVNLHTVDCGYWLQRTNGTLGGCRWTDRVRVYYATPAEQTPSNTFIGPAQCG
jgi:hypothetical protein